MSIEAMKQALEALETEADIYRDNDPIDGEPDHIWEAIKSLRQAIAEAEKQKPAAWGIENKDGQIYDSITPEEHAREEGKYTVALYREPQPKREPLTDEQAFKLVEQNHRMEEYAEAAVQLIRKTEAAHGIKREA